jgi:hypothetical protein
MELLALLLRRLASVAIQLVFTLGIHFVTALPVWVSLIIGQVIYFLPSWIKYPVRGTLNLFFYIVISVCSAVPIYIAALVVLYLIRRPSW